MGQFVTAHLIWRSQGPVMGVMEKEPIAAVMGTVLADPAHQFVIVPLVDKHDVGTG